MTATATLSKFERLDRLTEYLSKLNETEPERFSLKYWAASASIEKLTQAQSEWRQRYEAGEPLNCGTSACVVGHMPTVFPDTFRWGPRVMPGSNDEKPHVASVRWTSEARGKSFATECTDGVNVAAGALAKFFGGTVNDWDRIIYVNTYYDEQLMPMSNPPLLMVIERIRMLRDRLYNLEEQPEQTAN